MRAVLLVVALVGCASEPLPVIGPVGDGPGEPAECAHDDDCVAAGPKCCDCPAFAVPTGDEIHQACLDVVCPEASCSDSQAVACSAGRCTLTCATRSCELSCSNGFASDDAGCLTCACAAPVVDGCTRSLDCVRVRADCCGCAHGGRDTAVLRRDAFAHQRGLMCDVTPQCPSLAPTCEVDAVLACQQGRCALSTAGTLPPEACGRPDLPACPAGQVCVINGDSAPAQEQGVGVCRPLPGGRGVIMSAP